MSDQPGWSPSLTKDTGTKTCPRCAEDVKAGAQVCRFCGFSFAPPGSLAGAPPPHVVHAGFDDQSGKAIASFVCALLGFFFVSIPLGYSARRQMDLNGQQNNRIWATLGIWIGWAELAIFVVCIALFIIALVFIGDSFDGSYSPSTYPDYTFPTD